MAITFLDAYTRLMGLVNRPVTETTVLAEAKSCINDAILQLQRNHAYHYTERLFDFTYPLNTLQVNLTSICSGYLRDVQSCQIIQDSSANGGPILEYMTYQQIQARRRKYQRQSTNWSMAEEWDYIVSEIGHETYTGRLNKYLFFRMGENIGLYPTPTENVQLLLNAHVWILPLSADADTCFFLDHGYDLVMMLALKQMNIYMKEDNRFSMTQEDIAGLTATLIAWDAQVAESPITLFT